MDYLFHIVIVLSILLLRFILVSVLTKLHETAKVAIVMSGKVEICADMATTAKEARVNLERAIKGYAGANDLRKGVLRLAAAIDLKEPSIRLWLKQGNLNKTWTMNALRFSKAVKKPISDFIVDD